MGSTSQNNKRIAKNTLMLYFRMIFLLLVSLYTSRIVLATLGAEDYGIYHVVGGVVVILSFLNNAMAGATQRFLNFEMGRGNDDGLKRVFSSALVIHAIVAVVILFLAETVGLWFLNTYMNIAPERMYAAQWVYQFSVAAFLVGVLSVPYNACIIAHEKMSAFAYISILEAILKLVVVYLIQVLLFDKLIMFAFLIFCIGVLLRVIYGLYCSHHFEECHFRRDKVDKTLARQLLSFSSWTVVGNLGFILHTQGIAICVNMFFSAVVNAAQGISNTVNHAVSGFVSNFQTALNPQIVKSYAAGKIEEMHTLMFRGCRFSFYLISFFAIPLIIEAPAIIGFWLKDVPEYTIIFVRLVLAISVVNSYSGIMATAQGATGKIQIYQVTLTTIGAFHVPLTILAFWLGYAPYFCSWIYLVIVIILQIVRVSFVSRSTKMSLVAFSRRVLWPCLYVVILSSVIPLVLHLLWQGNFFVLAAKCLLSFLISATVMFALGMEVSERQMVINVVKHKILKKQ